MTDRTPPEITLEITGGSLTIRTAEAIYRILVSGEGFPQLPPAKQASPPSLPPAAEKTRPLIEADDSWDELEEPAAFTAPPTPAPAPATSDPRLEGDEDYFRDLSQDMYKEVGRLARRLSMSIRDVKVDKIDAIDLQDAGDQLENAKDQLENVVKMTEKATLKIMDLGENIQQAIDKARGIMDQMNTQSVVEAPASAESGAADEARRKLSEVLAGVADFLAKVDPAAFEPIAVEAESIKAELSQVSSEAPAELPAPAATEAPQGPFFSFPLDLVFQTTYELCTNETVKKHIKAMWDAGDQAFDQKSMELALNEISPKTPDEDNFLNLDLKGVLKALFSACSVDRFKQVLKKMASTVDQIFLDQTLPLEAAPGEAPAAPAAPAAPKPAAPQGPPPELLDRLTAVAAQVREAARQLNPPSLPDNLDQLIEQTIGGGGEEGGTNVVDPVLRKELENTMNVVFTAVNSIIEALSFQDLSGQTIYRIVRLLTDFQIQLLAMVVSFGSKIKAKASDGKVTTDQSEKMAQEEVDRVLGNLGVSETAAEGEEEPSKLDQNSVNELLDSMGF